VFGRERSIVVMVESADKSMLWYYTGIMVFCFVTAPGLYAVHSVCV
jgi:hypothetical protein